MNYEGYALPDDALLYGMQRVAEAGGVLGKLLPAARALSPDAVLVAPGTSCREQVAHFTGVKALHPAQLLQSLL